MLPSKKSFHCLVGLNAMKTQHACNNIADHHFIKSLNDVISAHNEAFTFTINASTCCHITVATSTETKENSLRAEQQMNVAK